MISGLIALWKGSVASIPSGWTLCDGTNGTPDLQDRFIIGAGGIHNPNDTGGANVHDHTLNCDGHTHAMPVGFDLPVGANFSGTTTSTTVTGSTSEDSNLPPYYALAYIMFI